MPETVDQTSLLEDPQALVDLGWKLRARVGERKRWYETPEETPHH